MSSSFVFYVSNEGCVKYLPECFILLSNDLPCTYMSVLSIHLNIYQVLMSVFYAINK